MSMPPRNGHRIQAWPAVRALLDRLSPLDRDLLVACRVDGLDPDQAALLLELELATLPARLASAERALDDLMGLDVAWQSWTARDVFEAFAVATEPHPEAVARGLASPKVQRALARQQRGRSWAPWAFSAGVALAAAAALLLLLPDATLREGPPEPVATMAPEVPATLAVSSSTELPMELSSPELPDDRAVGEDVRLVYQGVGRVTGTERAPRIAWSSGQIDVAVEPGRELDVRLETDEAAVRVTGTRFEVLRDALGTRVSVTRGSVATRCLHGVEGHPDDREERALNSGESLRCLPGREARWLARALALGDRGAGPEQVLQAALAGLDSAGPDSDYRGELVWVRVQSLEALGRKQEALIVASACLQGPSGCLGRDSSRAPDLHRTAARLAFEAGGCEAASPHLEALESAGTAMDRFALARCLEISDPARACDIVRSLGNQEADVLLHDAIRAMADRLGSGCPDLGPPQEQ